MSQIKITVLKQGKVSRNVISCSYFTMESAYRSFNKYTVALKEFLGHTHAKLRDFEVRIYTDDTGKDIALHVSKNYPSVSVLHYDCPQFREGKGHVGLFGTLVRFLPHFEDLDIAWCSDIDLLGYSFDREVIKRLEDNSCNIYISNFKNCYERNSWSPKTHIVANKFITRTQFPRALLTRFLNNISNGIFDDTIELLNRANHSKPPSKVPYGVDELFLNRYMTNSIKNNNYRVIIDKEYRLMATRMVLTEEEDAIFYRHYLNPSYENFIKLKRILQTAPPKEKYKNDLCFKELKEALPLLKRQSFLTVIVDGKDI